MGAIQDIILSFYSPDFYYKIAHERKGIGMGSITMLTVLMVLFAALSLMQAYPQLRQVMQQIPALADTLPAATFKDGKLSIDKPVPYRIDLGAPLDNASVIIDTNYNGDLDGLTQFMKQNRVVLLLTADKIVTLKDKNGQLEISELGKQPFTVTHENWHTLAEIIKGWGMTILTIATLSGLFIGVFLYNFLAAFIVGVIVKILSWIVRADFDYVAAIRLAAAARLPVTLITEALLLTGLAFGVSLAWLVWLAYLVFAAFASRQQAAA